MRVELSRYRVKPGMSGWVDEWMKTINDRLDECLATFEREKMYVETIFRETVGDEEFLYWFSIQGEGGEHVTTSEHPIDVEHLRFWNECIDPTYVSIDKEGREYKGKDLDLQVSMIPPRLLKAMLSAEREHH